MFKLHSKFEPTIDLAKALKGENMKFIDNIKKVFVENKREILFSIIYTLMTVGIIGICFVIWMESDLYTAILFAVSAISMLSLIFSFIANSIFKENVLDAVNKCMKVIHIWVLIITGIIAFLLLLLISAITSFNPLAILFVLLLGIAMLGIIWGCCVFLFIVAFAVLRLCIKHPYITLIIGVISAVIGVLSITEILPISQLIKQFTDYLFDMYIAIKSN